MGRWAACAVYDNGLAFPDYLFRVTLDAQTARKYTYKQHRRKACREKGPFSLAGLMNGLFYLVMGILALITYLSTYRVKNTNKTVV